MKNKNILFAFKRVVAALLDVSIFLIATMFAVLLIGEPIVERTTDIVQIREEYTLLAEQYNIKVWNEELGMYVDNANVTEEEKTAFSNDARVIELEQANTDIVMKEILISLTITSAVFYIAIPLFTKNNATLGKKAMNLKLINSKNKELKYHHIAIRGFSFIVVELFFGLITYGVIPFVSLALIMFSKNGQSIHDYIASTKVVSYGGSKDDIVNEEDDDYYKKIAKENARDLTVGGKKNDK